MTKLRSVAASVIIPAIASSLASGLSGCDSTNVDAGGANVDVIFPSTGPSGSPNNLSQSVCDPFSGTSTTTQDSYHGIVANMKYLTDTDPRYTNVMDYANHASGTVPATLFFSQLNTPTRYFSDGFTTQAGDLLVNQDGNTLYEYFYLHFDSQIQLTAQNPLGAYQFAVLSDDGSVFKMDQGSGLQTVVNNDGTHPSLLACATQPVQMSAAQPTPISVDYYQGPRYQIAMMLLWRPWPADPSQVNDPLCGAQGNYEFFNYSQTSPDVTPTAAYSAFLSRGWKVVDASNFVLPKSVSSNPCNPSTPAPVTTTITGETPSATDTNNVSISISFMSNYSNATFSCSLDSVSAPCTSPASYSGLSDGTHTFTVQASANGQTDATGATYTWTIDTTPPSVSVVTISTASLSAQINWTTNEVTTTGLDWGVGISTATIIPQDNVFVLDHMINLTGLTASTVYSFIMTGTDQAGNSLLTNRRSFLTTGN